MALPADPFVRRRTWAVADWAAWRGLVLRWGVSVGSLASGVLTLFVFRRGVPHVAWIVGYVVGLWLLGTVLAQGRERLVARGRHRVVTAGDYTIQTLYHGLLLFVLPGYFAAATLDGPTGPFFALLVAATLVTAVDPWYRALVRPRPWLGRAFFAVSLFAGSNLALPLVGVPPDAALLLAAAGAGLGVTPAHVRLSGSWRSAALTAGLATAGAVGLAWLARPAIPPAPLHLVGPTVARAVVDLEPVDPVRAVSAADLAAWGGLVAYTPVAAPPGLSQPVEHRWRHEGRDVGTLRLPTPVRGGRSAGFRTFSRKVDFPADPRGRWSVDVLTASGQLVGRVRFTVTS